MGRELLRQGKQLQRGLLQGREVACTLAAPRHDVIALAHQLCAQVLPARHTLSLTSFTGDSQYNRPNCGARNPTVCIYIQAQQFTAAIHRSPQQPGQGFPSSSIPEEAMNEEEAQLGNLQQFTEAIRGASPTIHGSVSIAAPNKRARFQAAHRERC